MPLKQSFHSHRLLTVIIILTVSLTAQAAPQDWLITKIEEKTRLEKGTERNEISLTNGLIRRTWRLAPNAATVALDNLMTGDSMLRGVKPEARIQINGMAFDVGGLKGQPNYAYLLDEWLDKLTADHQALRFTDYQVGKTKARFPWKRKRHSADLPWPPPGASLTMNYRCPPESFEQISGDRVHTPSTDRKLILNDDLAADSGQWKLHHSDFERSSFLNEGKFGEIYTPANTTVFAERSLPKGTKIVQCKINPGTDKSASWGPGITLLWPDRKVKFNLRAGADQFGAFDGRRERLLKKIDTSKAYYLRIELTPTNIYCDASLNGKTWFNVTEFETNSQTAAPPQTVRIGKTSGTGGKNNYSTPGPFGRCRISDFQVFGNLKPDVAQKRRQALAWLRGLTVSVHYEMYNGIPLMSKWMTIHNDSDQPVTLNTFTNEIMALVEYESHVEGFDRWNIPNIHVESDYSFGGMNGIVADHTTNWIIDPQYQTQVSYPRENPCLLESRPPVGPEQTIPAGETFETYRTFELIFDSTDRERKGLSQRRMYRTIAPWCTENPIMMHVRHANPKSVRSAVDQCAEVGFEMVILTFGSGFNIENESPAYLAQIKGLVDYAHSKNIELGGYSLLSSRRIGPDHDVIDLETGKPGGAKFGNAPCIGSTWGKDYFRKLYNFYEKTGFDLLEHDGSYPGDFCASTSHPGHKGHADSQWSQWKVISDFYKWCRTRGIFLNVPDFYYLAGSNKCGMGYRETNWSLPRAQQIIHGRQNIYDGTWTKTPSMGWMFVPLTQYHGGGAAATIEPLREHLDAYEAHLINNLGLGVQACYRGPRLYDSEDTKAVVKKWVDYFKKYRPILESDLIHLRRADGRDIDGMIHVNPFLKHKGMALLFNPLDRTVTKTMTLPLYYTGLTDTARIRAQEGKFKTYKLDRKYKVEIPISIPPPHRHLVRDRIKLGGMPIRINYTKLG